MSEHSIEELKRQVQAAASRVSAASDDLMAARARLEAAKLDATGLRGHIVEGPKWFFNGKASGTVNRILVDSVSTYSDEKVSGPIIKKDGTPGQRDAEVVISAATDLGLYQPWS